LFFALRDGAEAGRRGIAQRGDGIINAVCATAQARCVMPMMRARLSDWGSRA